YKFQTTGEKQTINFTVKDLKPQYRGRKLNKEVYNGKQPIEIGLLIGNKKEQDFEILFHNLEIIE
ncbi:MAG: CIA30 family protein, partial [Bacteroidota bacterium]|nr:CIA30 family protein [Bacteroidota bacterium]